MSISGIEVKALQQNLRNELVLGGLLKESLGQVLSLKKPADKDSGVWTVV